MTEVSKAPVPHATVVREKPLMNMRQILLMNLGFFGIQYSFGMQQTAVNPIYTFLGASPDELPLLNLAGPMTGLLIQPLIGALSDRTWSPRWGRRKPFFLIGAIGCSLCLFLFPFVAAVWMAALLLWVLDASNNTAMEPYRAFIADKLPPQQLAKGFLAQSFFTGFGITLANVSLFIFQTLIVGATDAGIPYWVVGSFILGSVCSIATVLVSVISTPEIPPSPEEPAALRAKKGGLRPALHEIWERSSRCPASCASSRWSTCSSGTRWSATGSTCRCRSPSRCSGRPPRTRGYADAVSWTGLVNGWYNIVTFLVAFPLVAFAKKRGAKMVHASCLLLATVGLLIFPHLTNKYLLFIPIIGLRIAWASIMGVPYIMAVRMIPSTRYGVYMGIINNVIVIPMLIQTVTFGAIYKHLLGDNPNNAITFAAILLACAAAAMLWIKEPRIVRDVDDVLAMPMGRGH